LTDFAVVVGIARYPRLGEAAPDLDGPDNDAKAVYDWLLDPHGGGLQRKNVKLIRSADFHPIDPDKPQPDSVDITDALGDWLEKQTPGVPLNRLYLYFSGHGFSPRLEEAALFTAESTTTVQAYVYATSWVRWFRTANRFREIVLWMDSCMNYQLLIPVSEVARPVIGTGVLGPAFMALAAQTKSALEHKMPDGKVHGVFTWTLLQGLGGGAADDCGRVTGDSLRSFLFTVMPEFLPDAAVNSTSVDLYPLVRADDGMVFRRLEDRPKFRVVLDLPPAAVGKELRIWTGRPLRRAVSEKLTSTTWEGKLVRGLYMAEVPDMAEAPADALRQGFQVSGAGEVKEVIKRTGPAVSDPDASELFSLDVVAGNAAAAISVMDYQFGRIFRATGELHEREMPGVYKVRVEFGRDITMIADQVLLLDRDGWPGDVPTPQLASPAPISGSASTHEAHDAPFEDAADRNTGRFRGPAADMSTISVMASYSTERGGKAATAVGVAPPPHPMHDLQLFDEAGQPIADLWQNSQVELQTEVDRTAVWERELQPGNYFLRQVLSDGRQYEGSVIVSPGWVTQIVLQRAAQVSGAADQSDSIKDVAMFMRQPGVSRAPDQDAVIEGARLALTQNRNLFEEGRGSQLAELLLTKFTDPIAGIIGGHLLLQASPVQAGQFDSLVTKLRSLVGPDHPDVEALSLRCTDVTLCTSGPFTAPPMFRHSWQLITQASYQRVELVPMELWQRVHASVALGATFVWAADEQTRAAHAAQLSRWISQYAEPLLPDAVRDAACRLQVPAGAAARLWAQREAPQQKQADV
jgi:hypothetical protein